MDDKKKAIKASFDEGLQKGDDIGKDLLSICSEFGSGHVAA